MEREFPSLKQLLLEIMTPPAFYSVLSGGKSDPWEPEEVYIPPSITGRGDTKNFLELVVRHLVSRIGSQTQLKKDMKLFLAGKGIPYILVPRGTTVKLSGVLKPNTSVALDVVDYPVFPIKDAFVIQFQLVVINGMHGGKIGQASAADVMDALYPEEWDELHKDYIRMNKLASAAVIVKEHVMLDAVIKAGYPVHYEKDYMVIYLDEVEKAGQSITALLLYLENKKIPHEILPEGNKPSGTPLSTGISQKIAADAKDYFTKVAGAITTPSPESTKEAVEPGEKESIGPEQSIMEIWYPFKSKDWRTKRGEDYDREKEKIDADFDFNWNVLLRAENWRPSLHRAGAVRPSMGPEEIRQRKEAMGIKYKKDINALDDKYDYAHTYKDVSGGEAPKQPRKEKNESLDEGFWDKLKSLVGIGQEKRVEEIQKEINSLSAWLISHDYIPNTVSEDFRKRFKALAEKTKGAKPGDKINISMKDAEDLLQWLREQKAKYERKNESVEELDEVDKSSEANEYREERSKLTKAYWDEIHKLEAKAESGLEATRKSIDKKYEPLLLALWKKYGKTDRKIAPGGISYNMQESVGPIEDLGEGKSTSVYEYAAEIYEDAFEGVGRWVKDLYHKATTPSDQYQIEKLMAQFDKLRAWFKQYAPYYHRDQELDPFKTMAQSYAVYGADMTWGEELKLLKMLVGELESNWRYLVQHEGMPEEGIEPIVNESLTLDEFWGLTKAERDKKAFDREIAALKAQRSKDLEALETYNLRKKQEAQKHRETGGNQEEFKTSQAKYERELMEIDNDWDQEIDRIHDEYRRKMMDTAKKYGYSENQFKESAEELDEFLGFGKPTYKSELSNLVKERDNKITQAYDEYGKVYSSLSQKKERLKAESAAAVTQEESHKLDAQIGIIPEEIDKEYGKYRASRKQIEEEFGRKKLELMRKYNIGESFDESVDEGILDVFKSKKRKEYEAKVREIRDQAIQKVEELHKRYAQKKEEMLKGFKSKIDIAQTEDEKDRLRDERARAVEHLLTDRRLEYQKIMSARENLTVQAANQYEYTYTPMKFESMTDNELIANLVESSPLEETDRSGLVAPMAQAIVPVIMPTTSITDSPAYEKAKEEIEKWHKSEIERIRQEFKDNPEMLQKKLEEVENEYNQRISAIKVSESVEELEEESSGIYGSAPKRTPKQKYDQEIKELRKDFQNERRSVLDQYTRELNAIREKEANKSIDRQKATAERKRLLKWYEDAMGSVDYHWTDGAHKAKIGYEEEIRERKAKQAQEKSKRQESVEEAFPQSQYYQMIQTYVHENFYNIHNELPKYIEYPENVFRLKETVGQLLAKYHEPFGQGVPSGEPVPEYTLWDEAMTAMASAFDAENETPWSPKSQWEALIQSLGQDISSEGPENLELDVNGEYYGYEDFREAYFSIAVMVMLKNILAAPHALPIPSGALMHIYRRAASVIEELWPNFVKEQFDSEAEYVYGNEEEEEY